MSTVKVVSSNGGVAKNSVMHTIAHVARVSNPTNQYNNDTAENLLRYLIKHQHWSPFEMVNFCLEINTTRDIARQILRHRSFSFQEFSQRYADPTDSLGFETREARFQDTKNRQNSIPIDRGSASERELNETFRMKQLQLIKSIQSLYDWAIERGIAKEQARALLPEGLTKSRLYMNGTLRSWIHYIQLRTAKGTQLEHRIIALQCAEALAQYFGMIKEFVDFDGLEEYNYYFNE
jgi:thymidylate synthase (FAD)